MADAASPTDDASDNQKALELVARSLQGLRFGQVTIIVQDGVIVQVERTEKLRVHKPRPKP